MKHNLHNLLPVLLCAILGAALPAALPAAVPLRWTVETSRLQPAVFDTVRGETLALEASFTSYGKPVATTNQTAFLCWQTNGMDSAWWTTNAVALAGNKATALFTPSMDPGAATVTGFICLSSSTNSNNQTIQQSNNYRAAFTLRYRHGPGETPNALPIPTKTIDFAEVDVHHPDVAPWVLKGGAGGLTPQDATNAALAVVGPVSNALTSVSNAAVSASALASAALPRADVTNAVDALVAVRPVDQYERWLILNQSEGFEITSYWTNEMTPDLDYGVYWKDANGNEGSAFEYDSWHSNEFYRVLQDEGGIASPITVKFERHVEINRYGFATTNALNKATKDLVTESVTNGLLSASDAANTYETQYHAATTYQAKGNYATTAYVASITNAQNIAIGRNSSAHSMATWQTAIGNQAKATNSYSSAFGHGAHSHGDYTINFSHVNSLSQIYFGDFTLRKMVTNDTQLWQDCASPVASNVVANAVTTYAPTNAIVALNQSVQYVVGSGSPLAILAPSSVADGCRDWLVYVNATADTPLNLDALGGVLVADAAYTNACAANKVTMLCFTEMTNNVFVIGRQELTPVK